MSMDNPPVRAPFFDATVELPRANENLPPARLALRFAATTREWANWALNIGKAVVFSLFFPVRTITDDDSPYTAKASDSVILVNATDDPVTVILPAPDIMVKKRISVKKIDASANAVTVDPEGAATIDGAATWSSTTQYTSVDLVTDLTNWFIV